MWSASRPWPQASWNRMPPPAGARTTGISPAGAGRPSSIVTAIRAARSAVAPGGKRSKSSAPPSPAGPSNPVCMHAVAGRDHLGEQADPGPLVLDPGAVRGGDQDPLVTVEVDDQDLAHVARHGPGRVVGLAQPGDLSGPVDRRRVEHVVGDDPGGLAAAAAQAFGPRPRGVPAGRTGPPAQVGGGRRDAFAVDPVVDRAGRGGGRLLERVPIQAVGGGVGLQPPGQDPDPGPPIAAVDHLLDPAVVEPDRGGPPLLGEELGHAAPRAKGHPKDVLDDLLVDERGLGGQGSAGQRAAPK